MKRILIVGISGAGKSTFAQKLSQKLDIPLHHLDKIYWQKNWVPIDKVCWHQAQNKLIEGDEWIIDGNYGGSFDLRFPRADTIIVFDIHPIVALWGVLCRTFQNWGKSRPDLNPGCPERISFEYYRYVLEFNKMHKNRIDAALEKYGNGKRMIRFKNREESKEFLL